MKQHMLLKIWHILDIMRETSSLCFFHLSSFIFHLSSFIFHLSKTQHDYSDPHWLLQFGWFKFFTPQRKMLLSSTFLRLLNNQPLRLVFSRCWNPACLTLSKLVAKSERKMLTRRRYLDGGTEAKGLISKKKNAE